MWLGVGVAPGTIKPSPLAYVNSGGVCAMKRDECPGAGAWGFQSSQRRLAWAVGLTHGVVTRCGLIGAHDDSCAPCNDGPNVA